MISHPRPGLLTILFTLRGSILPKVAPKVVGIALFAYLVTAAERQWPSRFPEAAGVGAFTLIGLALSIFLSFRNGACYDRWWEARKAWGALIAEARGLARTLAALLPGEEHDAFRRSALRRLTAFGHALHAVLRDGDVAAAAAPWLPANEAEMVSRRPNVPDAVLTGLAAEFGTALRAGKLSDVLYGVIEQKLAALSQIQVTCERIKTAPLPFAYTLLLYRSAWIYCLLLPFGLAAPLGWLTPVAAALVAYTFFGLDALGDELEEPFGTDANDLPLDALLRTVDTVLLDALGEPAPPQPAVEG